MIEKNRNIRYESSFTINSMNRKQMQDKTILVYDNDDEILRIIGLILASEYKQIETHSSCENLFEDIDRVKPDIILMDLLMPYCNGEKAIKLIRSNNKTSKIPVVVFSASAHIEKITKKLNATAILEKPFSIYQLRETVRNYIA